MIHRPMPSTATNRCATGFGRDGRLLRGVIFDLDGVLVTTDRYHYLSWKGLADELGLPFSEEVNHQLRGVSREESLRRLYASAGHPFPSPEDAAAQCARKNELYLELIRDMSPADVLPGVEQLLSGLKRAGVRCAVASASRNAEPVLARTELRHYIDAVVDGNTVTRPKPDTQSFELACSAIACLPEDCVGVEDSLSGIEALHALGVLAVGVGKQAAGADLQVASMAEVTVEALVRLFKKHRCT